MINISESFDIEAFAEKITELYQGTGYSVRTLKMKNGVKITVEKSVGGINMLLGMGQGITATCTLHGKEKDTISVNFSDGDWTGKIVGLIVGWFLCWIPCVTAIIGIVKQTGLEKKLKSDIEMALSDSE